MVALIYLAMKEMPDQEKFGLTSQIKRSSISIPSNIAEGAGRGSQKELKQFLHIALGSSFELETQLILARQLGFGRDQDIEAILEELTEIQKMLNAFIQKLKTNNTLISNN